MAPAAKLESQDSGDSDMSLIDLASGEIERIRFSKKSTRYHLFPPACLALLKSIEGNHRCVDCGEHDPQWAAVRYGGLLCLQCSGQHRSLGVQVSSVRSISMDEWSLEEVLSMLEGGNSQLSGFFERHELSVEACTRDGKVITPENVTLLRYKTKAAQFYRAQMELHVVKILSSGPYRGREISRRHHQLERRNTTFE
jgi:Putative GTPase activating protein for Arf